MFEAHVLHLLRKYLGKYVHGLSAEALKVSVWKGDVILKDLKLKVEALNSLKLPLTVKAGFVGSITLKVPWKRLGKEPVVVLIDGLFLIAHPASVGSVLTEEDRERLFKAKLQAIEEAESATLEAILKTKQGNPPGNSWLGSLFATIIGNLKISITAVHIRYEDFSSNPGNPFSVGLTLAKLAAVTTDEQGNETFDTSGALDKLQKALQLERLALYHDSNSLPWKLDKKWEDLSPDEWIEMFEDGIREIEKDGDRESVWALNRQYLVSPINGTLEYHRHGNVERPDPEAPFEKASLLLADLLFTITEAQYYDWIKLVEVISRYKRYVDVSHLRPEVSISGCPYLWWRYATEAVLHQRKTCYKFSWDQIRRLCYLRRHYVSLYASYLQSPSDIFLSERKVIEKDLDSKIIVLWRLLAHAKVKSARSKGTIEKKHTRKRWFSFGWLANSENFYIDDDSEQPKEERLSKEEWLAINKFLSYHRDEDPRYQFGKEMHNATMLLVHVSITHAAAKIVDRSQVEMICGRFEHLDVSSKIRKLSTYCDVSLRFYGLSAPEGSLAESVCSKDKADALAANFVYLPVGGTVYWKLSATISPCHVTILLECYERLLEFVKRSNAVSPVVVSKTATSLQMKIGKVTRRAQEQFQVALEEQNRFDLYIDLDAPKIRIPVRNHIPSEHESHFLFDFGHFTLCTKGGQSDEQGSNIYSRFYIYGRDIAAFFSEHSSSGNKCTSIENTRAGAPVMDNNTDGSGFCSVIDKCGVGVVVDQIKVLHPDYPSTCISIQVPNLRMHFSPTRYYMIMDLVDMLYHAVDDTTQPNLGNMKYVSSLYDSTYLSTEVKILVWKGIGNSVATWYPCFIVLSGLHVYVLESKKSRSYQRCFSLAGKQIYEIPSANIGGSDFCLALGLRGIDIQKIIESSSALIIQFRHQNEKSTWSKTLMQATYQASAPPTVEVLGEPGDGLPDLNDPKISNSRMAEVVVNGALGEARLLLYGKPDNPVYGELDEVLILEVFAGGAKVNILYLNKDLVIKMKLHSLQIKDEIFGALFNNTRYLARSSLSGDCLPAPLNGFDIHNELLTLITEDEDIFTDALPDFTHLSDGRAHVQQLDAFQSRMEADGLGYNRFDSVEMSFLENDFIKGPRLPSELFYEAHGPEYSDFVSLNFLSRNPSSPDYTGIDMEMAIHMSKLEFFCNRPTLVALMQFGVDINSRVSRTGMENTFDDAVVVSEELKDEENFHVKGLLGHGKDRIIFFLRLNFDSVTIVLNKEDDSQFAIFVQECFHLGLKVHPSSLSIDGTLGNFQLSDMSLGEGNCWGMLCDIRNSDIESLIKFTFSSYSPEDDDYSGYDYSLLGSLSGVRIVFLYRFVQEIMAYFMDLAAPHSEEAIKLVDKVGDIEWWIKKYEIDGLPALKLDLSLETPLIIYPRDSLSNDFIQLDVGQLKITNDISWYGGCRADPSAVHLDILHAEIHGINMAVGVNKIVGESMIKEGQGVDIFVRRSLRDVFRRVPTFSFELKVGSLHGQLNCKEYSIILGCAYMNLSEEPRIPTSFRGNDSGTKDAIRLLVDKVNVNSQIFLSRNVTVLSVEVDHALLELYGCIEEELQPLARVGLRSLWVCYRMTSFSECDLYVTLCKFSIFDHRHDTRPEMRLMLGLSTDASEQSYTGNFMFSARSGLAMTNSKLVNDMDVSYPTMFLMDCRYRESSHSYVIRVQQPRILVVPDFLIAVTEFFIPSLGTITGRKEAMDPKSDPILKSKAIVLSESYYKQREEVVFLSPNRQLVVDSCGADEYIYDGCDGTIYLSDTPEEKVNHSFRFPYIVFIGRGRTLRFVNVKFKNAFLLDKYTYLSSGSSYTVFPDDAVVLLPFDPLFPCDMRNIHCVDESSATFTAPHAQLDQSKSINFTFEAQVMCPEFVFYDGSKSFSDGTTYDEKFLCTKTGLSFIRYAKKENDLWIRILVQDLTVEAGSGLVVLDPIDVSAGYTSSVDKTNITLYSTDLCARLSLDVISLMLNFQSQVSAAVRFGDADSVIYCTNFEQIWGSPKGIGPCRNLTFWRPRAPPNYVVLGDCVTSRTTPPSQAVLAVRQMYRRVCKPIGFNLICLLSEIQGVEWDDTQLDCSLWMPIAPSGYSALGCVANFGSDPPLNHVVYCLRTDLLTSSVYSDCICTFSSSPSFLSGFSIWHSDNVLGSFFAHPSMERPPNGKMFDLNYFLLWSVMGICSPSLQFSPDEGVTYEYGSKNGNSQVENASQRDLLRSVSKGTNCYMSTPHFQRIWWDKGSDIPKELSIWRPVHCTGYSILGDCVIEGLEPPALGILFKANDPEVAAMPVQFAKVAHIAGKGFDEAFVWYPIAPPGYVSFGCLVTRADEAPDLGLVCCPRLDLVASACIDELPICKSPGLKNFTNWSIWKVKNQACTFLVRSDMKKPSSRLAYKFGEYINSKAEMSITAEFKLRFLSLALLDCLCGVVTPLFDTTITDIKLATHCESETLNTVIVASLAASSFNTQLEAWEPLVEPFDGVLKFETYRSGGMQSTASGRRVRISVTDVLNLNISSANIDMMMQAVRSWKKHVKVVEKSGRESGILHKNGEGLLFSVLDEENVGTVIVQNKLGCDLYLKLMEQSSEATELLRDGSYTSVLVPPPRFSDRLNVAGDTRHARYLAAIHVYEAQGLSVADVGNGHNFFCALRLIADGDVMDQQRILQSARTRCVKPSNFRTDNQNKVCVRWNELFIFEIPHKSSTILEVEVTNLAAKAGKGEVVGTFSFRVGSTKNILRKMASTRRLMQSCNPQNIVSYPLKKKGGNVIDDGYWKGCLLISTTYFQSKASSRNGIGPKTNGETDVGFWFGLNPNNVKESVPSLLPLSVWPRILSGNTFVMEVIVRKGKKHVIFRSLASVRNDSDVNIEILIGDISKMKNIFEARESIMVEEIFENQRYHPGIGWRCGVDVDGTPLSSTNDFTFSSKDLSELPLEPGWRWTTAWSIDYTAFVDSEGWAYGSNFKNFSWPLMSQESGNLVRRRRWIRTKQQTTGTVNYMNDILYLSPGSSVPLPWRSLSQNSDHYMLVRPHSNQSEVLHSWSRVATFGFGSENASEQAFSDQVSLFKERKSKHENTEHTQMFKLNQLEEKDILLYCLPQSRSLKMWLVTAVDASILHTELNTPVYDWKICISSPLRLENRLPCSAEFTVWEKTVEGTIVGKHNGVVSSHESVCVYSADIRQHIYMSFFIGGWVLEKDPALILDLLSMEHVSSFAMIHKESKRRLYVSVDRDMGGTNVAPKVIRLFVPYWIVNDSFLPLVYHIIQIDSSENAGFDSPVFSRAIKSAKTVIRSPTINLSSGYSLPRRNTKVLGIIDDMDAAVSMLSLQDYIRHADVLPSRTSPPMTSNLGISVAIRHSQILSCAVSFLELEEKGLIDINIFVSSESYCKVSLLINMTSDRTKVIQFQPRTLFINRLGRSICLQQSGTHSEEWIYPTDHPRLFSWQTLGNVELLKLRMDGFSWSEPFSIENEGLINVYLKGEGGCDSLWLRVEVRRGIKHSRYEVIFLWNSLSSPYRIENRTLLPLHYRQANGSSDSWQYLLPNSSVAFLWKDLGSPQLLELSPDGCDMSESRKYNINVVSDNYPVFREGPSGAIRVSVVKEEQVNVVKISNWYPDIGYPTINTRLQSLDFDVQQLACAPCSELHVILELSELGLSITDHTPEEIMYLSVENVLSSYSTGLPSGLSRLKLRVHGIQVDNQLPLTPLPVIFRPQRSGGESESILSFSMTQQSNGSFDLFVYPYIGVHIPENSAWLVNIHEPVIWRLHEMIQKIDIEDLYDTRNTAVTVDPIFRIGVLNISEVRFKLSMSMSPTQRPKGVLGFWSSLMTALGNTENMLVKINRKFHENICLRRSVLFNNAIANVKKDLLGQPFQLLSGVDILGNASSALGHMSRGVAALSMDKKFIQSRQRQENKGVEDLGDVIREGGGALAKGIFRGVTGILTKPIEGAKASGVEGFVQGVGKGIIGAAAQPVSGVLDLLSRTTEGANAMRVRILSALTSEEQLLRKRLPRVIGGDNLFRPYDEYKAQGQVILQLAESGSFFGQVDLFKVRGKFGLSDAYEDHFLLPKGKILVITHRRVILLEQPNTIGQKKFSPARDPCSILWDVSWDKLATMEFALPKDRPKAHPSQLIIYLQTRSTDTKEQIRVVKCIEESNQAFEVYSSILQTMDTYGPCHTQDIKKKVNKPYSPRSDDASDMSSANLGDTLYVQHVPLSIPATSTFGKYSFLSQEDTQ